MTDLRKISTFLFLITLSPKIKAQVDIAVSVAADYANAAMTELAANPAVIMLQNNQGERRYELVAGYLNLNSDDDSVTLSTGEIVSESGNASGPGLSFGYSNSFKDGWRYFGWAQLAIFDGEHTQTNQGVVTAKTENLNGMVANVSAGISYEFFRDNEKHILNVFAGPSLMLVDYKGDVKTFQAGTGTQTTDFEMQVSELIPMLSLGFMYNYKFSEKWRASPYGLVVVSLADECVAYDTTVVNLNTISGGNGSEPGCEAGASAVEGEVALPPAFANFGFRVEYLPWKVGFGFSSFIRDLILNPEGEDKAVITGALFSVSKSWD